MMGFFDSRSKTVTQEEMITDEQKAAQSALADFIKTGKLGKYEAGKEYDGQLGNYDISGLEQAGLDKLSGKFEGGGVNDLFNAGSNELKSILSTDQYDPNNPQGVYKGFKKEVLNNQTDALNDLKRQLSVTGNTFSTENARQQGRLQERTQDQLTGKLAELYQRYGDNKLTAAGQAINAGTAQEGIDQNRIGAAQNYGQIYRLLKDTEAKDKYKDFLRKHGELQQLPDSAQKLFQTKVPYGIKSYTNESPSVFMSMLGETSPLVGSYNQHEYGYSKNQSSISDIPEILAKVMAGGG